MRKLLILAAALLLPLSSLHAQGRTVSAEKIGNHIDVTIDGGFFTSYRFEDDEKYPFFFPVNGPASGGSVTSMRNSLYPHHTSLWFGCDLVNGGNYWQEGLDRGRIVSIGARILESGGNRVVIEDECIWKRPDAVSPIKDRRHITITAPSDNYFQIDFNIDLEMLTDVTILKTNHSLFSARIDEGLTVREGGVMVNSEGAKGEADTFGAAAPWMDCYGRKGNSGVEGIAIMQHPSNDWYPSKWFTRDYGFMSPTPMWWPENGEKNQFKKGEVLNFKYRVIVHKGTTEEAGIAKLFDQYAEEKDVTLLTLDPGHFHAALVQKTQYPQVSKDVYVYSPGGADLKEHLAKIDAYNGRGEDPTSWREVIYTGEDFLEKMISEKNGNVMVTAGNNAKKTEYIKKTLDAGINVLADKPMAIDADNFELLEECFDVAADKGILLYDIMTERFEITSILQRELAAMPQIYGTQIQGTEQDPGVVMESVHCFYKNVSGKALTRPDWFYDVKQQGEGIADVMVHLVDLVQWECFPEKVINYRNDIEVTSASHWSTPVNRAQFKQSTGLDKFPAFLKPYVHRNVLDVYANGEINYKIKDVCAKVRALWVYEAPAGGGDSHYSLLRGSKADLVIRQGAEQNLIPELYIEAKEQGAAYKASVEKAFAELAAKYPGVALEPYADGWHVVVPSSYRNGHEAHFGQVTTNFLGYLKNGDMPEWEVPNMIAKYYTTTQGWKLAQ